MDLDYTIAFMFSSHLVLFAVKLWALNYFIKMLIVTGTPNTEKYILIFKPVEFFMSIFTFIIVVFELYFLFSYFIDTELYFYQHLSILDQVFFTILSINYIKTEGKNYAEN